MPTSSLTAPPKGPNDYAMDYLTKLLGDDRTAAGRAQRLIDLATWTPLGIPQAAYDVGQHLGLAGQKAGAGSIAGALGQAGLAGLGLAMMGAPGLRGEAAPLEQKLAQEAPHIIAYHGSPHDFDKFDLAKIGRGQGAQAYGHGLYFAEEPGVAQQYRDMLQSKAPTAPPAMEALSRWSEMYWMQLAATRRRPKESLIQD